MGDVSPAAEEFPVVYHGEDLGTLLVAPRPGEATLTDHDRALVRYLLGPAAAALQATRAVSELVEARTRVVLAREEERRRLRRDLHDDLAPTFAGLGLGAAAIGELSRHGDRRITETATELLDGIRGANRQIREIAYDLRPPVLDDQGLVAAVRDRLGTRTIPEIVIDAPEERLALPAAVEVAALRIVQEAVTNDRRHAAATRCTVRIIPEPGELHVEIVDDGRGPGRTVDPRRGGSAVHPGAHC